MVDYEFNGRLRLLFQRAFEQLAQHEAQRQCTDKQHAIVFDIDGTLLWYKDICSEEEEEEETHAGQTFMGKHRIPIQPAVEFLQNVQTQLPNVEIIFLSARRCDSGRYAYKESCLFARPEEQEADAAHLSYREYTERELRHIGCLKSDRPCRLFIMPYHLYPTLDSGSVEDCRRKMADFKNTIRETVERVLKKTILLNVGDQPTDHGGSHYLHHICYQVTPTPMLYSSSLENLD